MFRKLRNVYVFTTKPKFDEIEKEDYKKSQNNPHYYPQEGAWMSPGSIIGLLIVVGTAVKEVLDEQEKEK